MQIMLDILQHIVFVVVVLGVGHAGKLVIPYKVEAIKLLQEQA